LGTPEKIAVGRLNGHRNRVWPLCAVAPGLPASRDRICTFAYMTHFAEEVGGLFLYYTPLSLQSPPTGCDRAALLQICVSERVL